MYHNKDNHLPYQLRMFLGFVLQLCLPHNQIQLICIIFLFPKEVQQLNSGSNFNEKLISITVTLMLAKYQASLEAISIN